VDMLFQNLCLDPTSYFFPFVPKFGTSFLLLFVPKSGTF
jgi:hypothetical protein